MTKCVKVMCLCKSSKSFIDDIQKYAQKLGIEGTVQVIDAGRVRIVANGIKERVDLFIDVLYKLGSTQKPFSLEVEPFLKDKDYRGVFRVIA